MVLFTGLGLETAGMTNNLKALMTSCYQNNILSCSIVVMVTGNTSELEAYNDTTGNLFLIPDPAPGDMPRTMKLAQSRNILIDTILSNQSFQAFPYIAMVDLDGVVILDDTVLEAIRAAILGVQVGWNALTFNSDQYYDWYALRCNQSSPMSQNGDDLLVFPCKADILGLQPDQTLEVASAFDGLGLYK